MHSIGNEHLFKTSIEWFAIVLRAFSLSIIEQTYYFNNAWLEIATKSNRFVYFWWLIRIAYFYDAWKRSHISILIYTTQSIVEMNTLKTWISNHKLPVTKTPLHSHSHTVLCNIIIIIKVLFRISVCAVSLYQRTVCVTNEQAAATKSQYISSFGVSPQTLFILLRSRTQTVYRSVDSRLSDIDNASN